MIKGNGGGEFFQCFSFLIANPWHSTIIYHCILCSCTIALLTTPPQLHHFTDFFFFTLPLTETTHTQNLKTIFFSSIIYLRKSGWHLPSMPNNETPPHTGRFRENKEINAGLGAKSPWGCFIPMPACPHSVGLQSASLPQK